MIEWRKYNGKFQRHEFDSPDLVGSGDAMQPKFMDMLYEARMDADVPFIINSGIRTKAHNKKKGGKEDSSHLEGWAGDIACASSRHRFLIVSALIKAGFTRIGVADTYIHVDCDPGKDNEVIWTY